MNKNQKNILFIFTFLILYVCNSVSYTDLQYDHNKLMKKEILTLKGGGQDSVEEGFIYPNVKSILNQKKNTILLGEKPKNSSTPNEKSKIEKISSQTSKSRSMSNEKLEI